MKLGLVNQLFIIFSLLKASLLQSGRRTHHSGDDGEVARDGTARTEPGGHALGNVRLQDLTLIHLIP